MRLAVLIQAHKAPAQLAVLCSLLEHTDIDIYVSVDGKCDSAPFRGCTPRARFVEPRTDVRWGRFSQVEATLRGLEYIASSGCRYDYVTFISGQDLPLVTPRQLLGALADGGGAEYLSWRRLDSEADRPTLRKAEYPHFALPRWVDMPLRRVVYRLPLLRRHYPVWPVYKGSSWWTLTWECVRYILDFTKENPGYAAFHRRVLCSDEFYFHNIIMHSPFAPWVVCDDRRYIEWPERGDNPRILRTGDYDKIMCSGKWFARKFDAAVDTRIIEKITAALRQKAAAEKQNK